ncbi:MAG: hypothetical protein H8E27_12195 [Verrucomicrobia subdivision 3 bacterium]|nr:hypothetical protein [Limisphaerales bacterium]
MLKAVKEEEAVLKAWWACRSKILRKLEHHLYTGDAFKKEEMEPLAKEFGWLNAKAGLIEARAFAEVEDTLTHAQWRHLRSLRQNPGLASKSGQNRKRGRLPGLSRELAAQYEDLYAKAFTWLTGTMKDNQTIPLGQPAQFFGFVSIRHKSGHGASRGKIYKQFANMLNAHQQTIVTSAMKKLGPQTEHFIAKRDELLVEMAKLRSQPDTFDAAKYKAMATELGLIEIRCGMTEARAYHLIRKGMTPKQTQQMMAIRSEYILDQKTMENMTLAQRGAAIYNLCAACHSNTLIAPDISLVFESSVASAVGYEYSPAMKQMAQGDARWSTELLDQFLAAPTKTVPGTKMGFQGLLNETDRQAIISYLKALKAQK